MKKSILLVITIFFFSLTNLSAEVQKEERIDTSRKKIELKEKGWGKSQKDYFNIIEAFIENDDLTIYFHQSLIHETVIIKITNDVNEIIYNQMIVVNESLELDIQIEKEEEEVYLLEIEKDHIYLYGKF